MHEYKFDEIEDDDNPGGNSKQTKTQDATAKKTAIEHIPTERVIVNQKMEVIPNISETRKGIKL